MCITDELVNGRGSESYVGRRGLGYIYIYRRRLLPKFWLSAVSTRVGVYRRSRLEKGSVDFFYESWLEDVFRNLLFIILVRIESIMSSTHDGKDALYKENVYLLETMRAPCSERISCIT